MRFWTGVIAAFGAGTLIGIGVGTLLVEDKLKKEYTEANASFRRALEAARIDAETPALNEEELDQPLFLITRDSDGVALEGAAVQAADRYNGGETIILDEVRESNTNPYHKPIVETSPQIYASYAELDEEDYYEEDGRAKEQLTMVYVDNTPRFFSGGEEIEDWMERVGGTVVDDMRTAVGNGTPVLYIRNNQTDVDYEVLFDQP